MRELESTVPPHAPDTRGRLRKILGAYHVTGVFWFRFHHWGMSFLPEWGIHLVIFLFSSFFFVSLRRIRKAIAGNLEPVLGPCGWWQRQARIWRTMWTYAWCLSERYESLSGKGSAQISADGEDRWHELMASDRGLVVVTAHIGHWEIGSRLGLTRAGRRVHVIREAEVDPKAQEFIRELLSREKGANLEMHFANESDPSLGIQLLSALRDGDVIAVQGDRPRAGSRSWTGSLFGRPLELPVGPAAIARAAGVPLVPVFVFREGRHRSRVFIRAPIPVPSTEDRTADIGSSLQKIADEVGWAIRHEPHQWFCFRELWPEHELPA
jgi:lauroyl/myristoyl acyltransferase